MLKDSDWLADLSRIEGGASFLREQSLMAIWVYQFGRQLDHRPSGLRKAFLTRLYWFLFHVSETVTGISLPKTCEIGPGLRILAFWQHFFASRRKARSKLHAAAGRDNR